VISVISGEVWQRHRRHILPLMVRIQLKDFTRFRCDSAAIPAIPAIVRDPGDSGYLHIQNRWPPSV
jgi:hypothetical protein